MNSKFLLFILFSLLFSISGFSQTLYFSQYNQTPTLLNPALVGDFPEGKLNRLFVQHRGGWNSTYSPSLLSYERSIPINKDKLGLASTFFQSQAGEHKFTRRGFILSLACHKYLNEQHNISIGLSTSIINSRILKPELWEVSPSLEGYLAGLDSIPHIRPQGFFHRQNPDLHSYTNNLNAGVLWTFYGLDGERWQFGASLYGLTYVGYSNLFRVNNRASKFLQIHINYRKKINERLGMMPSVLSEIGIYRGINLYDLRIGSDFQLRLKEKTTDWLYFGAHYRVEFSSLTSTLGYRHKGLLALVSYEFSHRDNTSVIHHNFYEFSLGWLF